MGCNDKPGGCGRPRRSKARKASKAIAGAVTPAAPSSGPAPAPEHVSVHRWCGLGWWGVPDPIRRHVARSLGMRSIPQMPGCGCLVRVTERVDDWEEAGGAARLLARGVAWLAPWASRALSRLLAAYLAVGPPSGRLRRLLKEATVQAFGKVAPKQVIRLEGVLPRGFSMHGLAAEARKNGRPAGDLFVAAIQAAQSESARRAGAGGAD